MSCRQSDQGARRAAGLGAAALAASALSLVVAVVMANLLGPDDYADYAALLSVFLVLSIPGTAMQSSVARDVAAAGARSDAIAARVRALARVAALVGVVILVVALLARHPLARLTGTPTEPLATALTVGVAAAWLVVSLQRGGLQGIGRPGLVGVTMVGEAVGRLLLGIVLVVAGAGVGGAVGAYVATLLALGFMLDLRLPRAAAAHEPVRALLRGASVPAATALLLAAVQNLDILVVQHVAPGDPAGRYAAASLAAKSIVWLAVGLGLFLLPEASRRAAAGRDPQPLLVRCLALTAAGGAVMVAILGVQGPGLVRLVFGDDYRVTTALLVTLGVAMSLLAGATLVGQYLLALRRAAFLLPLLVAAVCLVPVMAVAGPDLERMATALLAVQGVLALALGALVLTVRPTTIPRR